MENFKQTMRILFVRALGDANVTIIKYPNITRVIRIITNIAFSNLFTRDALRADRVYVWARYLFFFPFF